jgi:hypothetical protein
MKANIDVKDRREADAIKRGLEDPELRAIAVLMGTLTGLAPGTRRRVMTWVVDRLEDQPTEQAAATNGGNTSTEDRGA